MNSRSYIAALVAVLINALVFAVGAVTLLLIPAFGAFAAYLLPTVMALSLFASPVAGWLLAPRLQASGGAALRSRPYAAAR